jgi:hypothetical protein
MGIPPTTTYSMSRRPRSSFDPWTAKRLNVDETELTTKKVVQGLPRQRDLADGPESPMGGRLASHLDSYSDTEFEDLVHKGEQFILEIRAASQAADC